VKYAFIRSHSKEHKTSRLCHVLQVSVSGYYAWRDRPESARAQSNRALMASIDGFHKASRRTYGSPRIHRDLQACGERVGVNRVAQLMRRHGVQSKMAKKFVITTDSKNTLSPAPDRIRREFTRTMRDQAWVSDTTFISTRKGWMYFAVILDLYSRKVIGWAMRDKNDSQLVRDALTMALAQRGNVKGVIVHSDQGSTYASSGYQALLAEHGLICSMSRKGECLDNAVAESFFGTLKTELVDDEDYRNHDEARRSLFEYVEVFYNRQRRHSHLDYLSPVQYEARSASF
jgi:putative transposase